MNCTNCLGQSAVGCHVCMPHLHPSPQKIDEALDRALKATVEIVPCPDCQALQQRIKELTPEWVEITDDPESWPPTDRPFIYGQINDARPHFAQALYNEWSSVEAFRGCYWRPLIKGIDTPEQAQ